MALNQHLFGDGAQFHHIGLVVQSLADEVSDAEPVFDPVQKVKILFAEVDGVTIEYLEPASDDSPVAASLKKGNKLLHLCFGTPDIEGAIEASARHGFRCIAEPVPAVAFDGRRIAWLFSKTHGVVELLESE